MPLDRSLVTRSTSMLLLKLLQEADMYGYQMIEQLRARSDETFSLKAGTLYPLLHDMEKQGLVRSYAQTAETGRERKYYSLTAAGRGVLGEKVAEWSAFSAAVDKVLAGGYRLAAE